NAAVSKKNKKKGKTLTLTDFLAEDSGGNAPPSYAPTKPTSWADETDDLEGDGTVPSGKPPKSEPYRAYRAVPCSGKASLQALVESKNNFLISAVRLPREPSNPERLKGFGYAEFDDIESLLRALSLNEENLGNRRIRVDIADQSNEKGVVLRNQSVYMQYNAVVNLLL
uniref:Eukaryotic translation initiation factor 4B-like n=1 Tax=Sinocyclocheilus grahami TaxID=75366 RepID=A0A672MAR6_SINGR